MTSARPSPRMRGKCMDDIEEGEATHSRCGEGTVEGRLVVRTITGLSMEIRRRGDPRSGLVSDVSGRIDW